MEEITIAGRRFWMGEPRTYNGITAARLTPIIDEECDICILHRHGKCVAQGETDSSGDCPSFKD